MEANKKYSFYGWKEAAGISCHGGPYDGIRTPLDLYDALTKVWCRETCAPRMRDSWTEADRTLGQCSITAFLAQDIFGGKVYGVPRPGGTFHCYNEVDGVTFDLTSEQFGGEKLCYENNPEQSREVHFAKEEKQQRYVLLKELLRKSMQIKNRMKEVNKMNEVIKNMADRRSIRAYKQDRIPREILEQIVEAGYYSPNAGNKQHLRMVICEDPKINERLGKLRMLVTQKFWWPKEGEPFEFTDEELDACDKDNSFYNAPCVIYLFSKADFEFAEGDAYIMSNDLCLAARSFDIGSCVISVATDYFLVDSAKQILKDWGIPEDYRIFAHTTLGYPEGGFPEAKEHDLYAPPLWVE